MIVCNRRVVLPWVKKRVDAMFPTGGVGAIGQQSGGEMVAGVVYDHYTGASIQATIAVKPKARLSKMFLWAIFDYPFNQLGVKKIIANVKEDNDTRVRVEFHHTGSRSPDRHRLSDRAALRDPAHRLLARGVHARSPGAFVAARCRPRLAHGCRGTTAHGVRARALVGHVRRPRAVARTPAVTRLAHIPLPAAWLESVVPGLENFRVPFRWTLLIQIAAPILAGVGAHRLASLGRKRTRRAVYVVLGVLLVVNLASPPIPVRPAFDNLA